MNISLFFFLSNEIKGKKEKIISKRGPIAFTALEFFERICNIRS